MIENKVRSSFTNDDGGVFLQRKIYQIIAVMDSGGSNTTASNMPILIWIPKVQTCTVNFKLKFTWFWIGRWKIRL